MVPGPLCVTPTTTQLNWKWIVSTLSIMYDGTLSGFGGVTLVLFCVIFAVMS